MNLDINTTFIHKKIDEYIIGLYKTGLVTDKSLLNKYSNGGHKALSLVYHIFLRSE